MEELRKQYKNLLKKYHPDNGGSEEATKEINTEYERLLKILKDKHDSRQQGIAQFDFGDRTDPSVFHRGIFQAFQGGFLL